MMGCFTDGGVIETIVHRAVSIFKPAIREFFFAVLDTARHKHHLVGLGTELRGIRVGRSG